MAVIKSDKRRNADRRRSRAKGARRINSFNNLNLHAPPRISHNKNLSNSISQIIKKGKKPEEEL